MDSNKEVILASPETMHEVTKKKFEAIDAVNPWVANRLAHIISEISEAWEALRDNDQECFRRELADAVIYIFDLSYHAGFDIQEEINKKVKRHHEGMKHNPY